MYTFFLGDGDVVITFCGHADYIGGKESKKDMLRLLEEIIGGTEADILLGGYGGFDSLALSASVAYRAAHGNVRLFLVSPYPDGKCRNLPIAKEDCDEIVYPPIENAPRRLAIIKRNEWMIRESEIVIAHVKHCVGGAYRSLCYAQKLGKSIIPFE